MIRSQEFLSAFLEALWFELFIQQMILLMNEAFVILNQKENTGIGEIISFGDLIIRKANSYYLVGICSLDKTEQPNSLFLFSTHSSTSRIRHLSNDSTICFVSMISLPMSDTIFLTGAFDSIITLNSSVKQKRGYFTLHEIENNFHSNNIEDKNMNS